MLKDIKIQITFSYFGETELEIINKRKNEYRYSSITWTLSNILLNNSLITVILQRKLRNIMN